LRKKDTRVGASSPYKDFCIYVVSGGRKYLVLTEDLAKDYLITTRIYLGGEIISTRKVDYKNILNTPDPEIKIRELMHRQHERTINSIKVEKTKEEKTTAYHLDKVKTLLQRKDYTSALTLVTTALEQYPYEPFLLSYYGYLEAIVNKNYTFGINSCLEAIEILDEKIPFGHEFFYPVLYLNLGRVYLLAGNKKDAIKTFNIGLAFDNENIDLMKEIRNLGIRKKPIVAFLPRLNPINKYVGKLLHTLYKLKRD